MRKKGLLLMLLLLVAFCTQAQNRYYVKQGGAGCQDGSSWDNAMGSLQYAVNTASQRRSVYGGSYSVWVAEGTYHIDTNSCGAIKIDYDDGFDQYAFCMLEGVNVYGGFAGDETDLTQRNWQLHPTVLDGENRFGVLADDYYYGDYQTTTLWDGFVIQNGVARNGGGVILDYNSRVYNSIIQNNNATDFGGGAYLNNGARLVNCVIRNNSVPDLCGGGVYSEGSYILNCVVEGNDALYGGGGSMNNSLVESCIFRNNTAGNSGGACYVWGGYFFNSLFYDNNAYYGGAVYSDDRVSEGYNGGMYDFCTFVNNHAELVGGIYMAQGEVAIIRSSILWNNVNNQSEQYNQYGNDFGEVLNCAVEGGIYGDDDSWHNIVLAHANEGDNEDSNYVFFVNPEEDNYHLDTLSVCINAGRLFDEDNLADLDGNYRVFADAADIGCFEWNDNVISHNLLSCSVTIEMHDSHGDGWNGAMLSLYSGDSLLTTVGMNSGSSSTVSASVPTGVVKLQWYSGDYDAECSFSIKDEDGFVLYTSPTDMSRMFRTVGNFVLDNCPSCRSVQNIGGTVDAETAAIYWDSSDAPQVAVYAFAVENPSDCLFETFSNTSELEFTGLIPSTQYQVYIWSICGEGDTSRPQVVTFTTGPHRYDHIYVKADAQGNNNGSSWNDAFTDLNVALDEAERCIQYYGDYPDIWVAAGTYYGDLNNANAFVLRNGVNVYGGFVGDEPADFDLSERNMQENVTILDGQNAQRVLYQASSFDSLTIWDGVTVAHGYLEDETGGGAYIYGNLKFSNCIFRDNKAYIGAGIYTESESWLYLENCQILNNSSTKEYGAGGGIYSYYASVVNSRISGNSAYYGAGVYASYNSFFYNCIIDNNMASQGLGAVYVESLFKFEHCDIVNNRSSSDSYGSSAGIYGWGTGTFNNCIVWGNRRRYDVSNIEGEFSVNTCAIEGGYANGSNIIDLASSNDGTDYSSFYVRFVDPDNGDYHLHSTSSLINAGEDSLVTHSVDYDGNTRIFGNSVDIGAFELNDCISCSSVVNLHATNVTSTSARLAWMDTVDNRYFVIYGIQGSTAFDTVTTTDTTVTLIGLELNREYTAKVRTLCDSGVMSLFSIPISFTTSCDMSLLLPLSEYESMMPADSTLVYSSLVNFSWSALENATSYDLYVWKATDSMPLVPTVSGLFSPAMANFILPEYEYGATYKWKVVAWNECINKTSPVMTLCVSDLPDLHVSQLSNSAIVLGQPFNVSWTVRNDGRGSTPVGSTWTDRLYISNRPYIDGSGNEDLLGFWENVSALDTGQSYERNVTVSLPLRYPSGQCYLFVLTDASLAYDMQWIGDTVPAVYAPPPFVLASGGHGNILESNETDNSDFHDNFHMQCVQVQLPPLADLEVVDIVCPSNFYSGSQVSVTATIKNTGAAPTISDGWTDVLYISSSPTFSSSALQLATVWHSASTALASDSTYSVTFTTTVPLSWYGEAYFYVKTNCYDNEYEHIANDNNVSRSNQVNIFLTPPADLVVSEMNVSSIISNISPFDISYTVNNIGMGVPDINSWYDNVYLSTSPVLPSVQLNSNGYGGMFNYDNMPDSVDWYYRLDKVYHYGSLASGTGYTLNRTCTLPSFIANSDTFYIIVHTDADSNVFEYQNEDNNVVVSDAKAIQIHYPDFYVSDVSLPDTIVVNHSLDMEITLSNEGAKSYSGYLDFDVYFSQDSILSFVSGQPSNAISLGRLNRYVSVDSGAQQAVTATLWFPNSTVDGSYYVYVVVNGRGGVLEENVNNNISRSGPYYVCHRLIPDLVLCNVVVPDTLYAGQIATITYDVVNKGETNEHGAADVFSSKCFTFFSVDYSWCPVQMQELPNSMGIISLAVGDTLHYSQQVLIPPMLSGNNDVRLSIDEGNYIQELDENNNIQTLTRYVQPIPFDIEMQSVNAPATCTTGDTIDVSWTVSVKGMRSLYSQSYQQYCDVTGCCGYLFWQKLTTGNLWKDRFYISYDQSLSYDDISLTSVDVTAAMINDSTYTINRTVVIPHTLPGQVYLIAVADYEKTFVENNRLNNTMVKSINARLAPQPNLHITSLDIDDVVSQRQGCLLRYTVVNDGEGYASGSGWTDAFYCGGTMVASVQHNEPLAPGESYTDSVEFVVPYYLLGDYAFRGVVDVYDNIYEFVNEDDNAMTRSITVVNAVPCDLVVANVEASSNVVMGSPLTVSYTVQNTGDNSISGYVKDGIYLSVDNVFDDSDVLLGTFSNYVSLAEHATISKTVDVSVQDVTPGNYYVLVRTNIMNAFNEISFANNSRSSVFTTEVALPSLAIGESEQLSLASGDKAYYRMVVGPDYAGQTLSLTLSTDAVNAFNGVYMSYEAMPSAARHDFESSQPYVTQQQILVPTLQQGVYYILVSASTTNSSEQPLTLLAEIIDFEILHLNATSGNNTGSITTKITGAKFDTIMDFRLVDANGYVPAQKVKFDNSTQSFVTFNLIDLPAGTYNVEAELPGGIVTMKENAFVVEQGLPAELVTQVWRMSDARIGNVTTLNIEYGNNGATDLYVSGFMVVSVNGHPIGLSVNDLANNQDTLFFSTAELGMDPDIIRPNYFATKTIYSKATTSNTIIIEIYPIRRRYE